MAASSPNSYRLRLSRPTGGRRVHPRSPGGPLPRFEGYPVSPVPLSLPRARGSRTTQRTAAALASWRDRDKMDRPLVARATSSDDSPTPGYLYGEIAQMTHANFEGCRQLTAYLLERIKKPNHNIKFKCLHIIKVRYRKEHGCCAREVGHERLLYGAGVSERFRCRSVICGVISGEKASITI